MIPDPPRTRTVSEVRCPASRQLFTAQLVGPCQPSVPSPRPRGCLTANALSHLASVVSGPYNIKLGVPKVPTEAEDNCLKAIYQLAGDGTRATTAALADLLSIAPASVTGMLKKLSHADPPWIDYQKHHGALLTSHGRTRALEIIRHHRLIELFLHRILGYRWDEVHTEAEKLEHAISETFEDRIAAVLGDPDFDPHGHPIPRKDGTLPKRVDTGLVDLEPGDAALVSRVSDHDPEMLQYLASIGVGPGVRLRVLERSPFDGPLLLQIGEDPTVRAFGMRLASAIRVREVGEEDTCPS